MDEEELKQIEEDCQRFRNTVSTVLYLVPMFFMAYVVWCNWWSMDLIEAKKNLESLHQDKEKLESLNHLNSTFQFKQACQQRIHDIDKQISNIQHSIKRYARP